MGKVPDAGPPLLVVAAVIGFLIAVVKLTERYPRTMLIVIGFLSGLLGGRR
jgi:hypothetical protein